MLFHYSLRFFKILTLLYACLVIVVIASPLFAATGNENILFLHHSTGGNLYNEGDVPEWFVAYNNAHGTNYTISERAYPTGSYPWNNYPYDYWNLWVNGSCNNGEPSIECLPSIAASYDVVIFKHCFPGAGIQADSGSPDISSSTKSMENYLLQYRALRELMDTMPDTKFIVWTLVPLHRLATNTTTAARAKAFVDYVNNDWLTEDGNTHPNIFVFDFWGYAAEDDPTPDQGQVNTLRYLYERSHSGSDSHPNSLANETIGPFFSQFIVDTIEESPQEPIPGDVNNDNNLTLHDVILALQVVTGYLPGNLFPSAAVDGQGRIGIKDAVHILNAIAE